MNALFRSATAVTLLAAALSASALTLVQTTSSSFSYNAGGTYGPLSFDAPILALSPSQGVLTAVDVAWTTSLTSNVAGTYSGTAAIAAFGATADNALSLGSVSLSRRNVAAGTISTIGPFIGVGFSNTQSVSGSATDLTPFVGSGAVSPATWTSTVQTVGANLLFDPNPITGTVTGTATVTYTYSPVPEPGALAALGLGAVALLKRRKRA